MQCLGNDNNVMFSKESIIMVMYEQPGGRVSV